MYYTIYKSRFGNILLIGDNNSLSELSFINDFGIVENMSLRRNDPIFSNIVSQLEAYFDGKRKSFEIKLNLQGTDFQKQVWEKLLDIPYGGTASYKDIALMIDKPTASRAVGTANSKNPIAIIIPCHRVVCSNGELSGYAYGTELKKKLLELEKSNKI